MNENPVNRRVMTGLSSLVFGLGLFLTPQISLAAGDHLAQAISHTREAVVAGREGKQRSLVLHARNALEHAVAAQRERPNYHVERGVYRLKETIKFGEEKRRAATRIADRALQELELAPK